MMDSTDVDLSQFPPYTVMLWKKFIGNPQLLYNLFCTSYPSDRVLDMTGIWINSKLKELKVDNLEELQRLRNDLLTKPILFHVKVTHLTRNDHEGVLKPRSWTKQFVVLVNTRHPSIREILSHKLNEITQKMQEGEKFCLKLDFGPPVQQWFSGVVDPYFYWDSSRSSTDFGHMEIFIHNYTTPIKCCSDPLLILLCFPFWLLFGGSCYWDCPVVIG
ncbi:uncharacterized protein LOC134282472 [Saccostrea cucullata]|uniref:uncharacterized protein LOC134282472 n=2 Tax=Saccostrea cuccullata TaxID=36930 RepID=UPI002ED278A8